jgi:hypothetical protein
MTCNRITIDLDTLLDGELAAGPARRLEQHAAECLECGRLLARGRALQTALRAQPIPEPTAEFLAAALQRAKQPVHVRGGRGAQVVAGLSGALAAGIVAVVVTALWMRAPSNDAGGDLSVVNMTVNETRTVNLVFAAASSLEGVSLTVELPQGVEVQGYAGRRELGWSTRLHAGNNVLALPLIAVGSGGGQLVAHLRHGDDAKTFVVTIDVS